MQLQEVQMQMQMHLHLWEAQNLISFPYCVWHHWLHALSYLR